MNTNSPLVSVIIATFNRSNALQYAIASALNQTYSNMEVLVIGDGCTDDTQLIVENNPDPRLRWIGLQKNSGHQSTPNNVGLKEAQGDYVAYLGHDDIWLPHHLQECVKTLLQGYDLSYGLTLLVRAKNAKGRLFPKHHGYSPGKALSPSSVVHRKSITDSIGGWKNYAEIDLAPDTDLWQRMYNGDYSFALVQRISVIKIPAATRKDVYITLPDNEQKYWLGRIKNEPDFEIRTAIDCYVNKANANANFLRSMKFYKMLKTIARECLRRIKLYFIHLWTRLFWKNKISKIRKYKGL